MSPLHLKGYISQVDTFFFVLIFPLLWLLSCWMWFLLFQSTRKIFVIRYFHSSSNVRFQSLAACFNQTQMSGSLFLLPPVPLEASSWFWINPNPPIHSFTHTTHTFLMWWETSLKVSRLGRAALKARELFSQCCQCFFIFLFTFHLISTCLYLSLFHSLSVSSVLLDVPQFFWRHYKQNNSKHLPFPPLPLSFTGSVS